MKLWILRPVSKWLSSLKDSPWEPAHDKCYGFVVRANTEEEARRLAHKEAGEENNIFKPNGTLKEAITPWKDAKYTTCIPLTDEGDSGIIIKDRLLG